MSETRRVAIRFSVVMEYDVGTLDDEAARFFVEENHCCNNIVRRLAEMVEEDSAQSVCNVCPHSNVELLPEGTDCYGKGRPL